MSTEATLAVRAVPNGSRDAIVGFQGDVLRVKLRAPAVEGKANAALLAFLAETLGLKANQLRLVSGEKSRTKRLAVSGLDAAEFAARIEACLPR